MSKATSYFLAGSLLVAFLAARASFTTPPWPSELYYGGTNKDARVSQIYSACVERSYAAYGFNALTNVQPYINEREACVRFKQFIVLACTNFVDTTRADTDLTFTAYFAANPDQDAPPLITVTQLLAWAGAPTNYFAHTPWQQLNGGGYPISNVYTYGGYSELDYGWKYATAMMSRLVASYAPYVWFKSQSNLEDNAQTTFDYACSGYGSPDECASVDYDTWLGASSNVFGSNGFVQLVGTGTNTVEGAVACKPSLTASYTLEETANLAEDSPSDIPGGCAVAWSLAEVHNENAYSRSAGYPLVLAAGSEFPTRVDWYGRVAAWTENCLLSATSGPPYRFLLHSSTNLDADEPDCDWGDYFGPQVTQTTAAVSFIQVDPFRGNAPTPDDIEAAIRSGCIELVVNDGWNGGGPSASAFSAVESCLFPLDGYGRIATWSIEYAAESQPYRANAVVFWPFQY